MVDHFSAPKECKRCVCVRLSRLALNWKVSITNFCQCMNVSKKCQSHCFAFSLREKEKPDEIKRQLIKRCFCNLKYKKNECLKALTISLQFFCGKNITITLGLYLGFENRSFEGRRWWVCTKKSWNLWAFMHPIWAEWCTKPSLGDTAITIVTFPPRFPHTCRKALSPSAARPYLLAVQLL